MALYVSYLEKSKNNYPMSTQLINKQKTFSSFIQFKRELVMIMIQLILKLSIKFDFQPSTNSQQN